MIDRFNDFRPHNEELFGLSKAEKTDRRIKNLQNSLDKYLSIWTRKGSVKSPTQEQLDKFWHDAEMDDYKSGDVVGGSGGLGIDPNTKVIRYRKSSEIRTKGVGREGVTESVKSDERITIEDLHGINVTVVKPISTEYQDFNIVVLYRDGTCTHIDNFHGVSKDYDSVDSVDNFDNYELSLSLTKVLRPLYQNVDKVYVINH